MSSSTKEEIELLERVLLRFGNADTDEKLETAVGKFLAPVILKITSPHENVRCKVIEVLTHLNKRLKSRSNVQIPVEALLNQFKDSDSAFLHNFSIIYIKMGYPRLPIDKQSELAPNLLNCLEGKAEIHQDKLLLLILPLLEKIKIPDDPDQRKATFGLDEKPNTKKLFLNMLQDVLLLPYGVTHEADVPPGLSPSSFKRLIANNWSAEDLESMKKGVVRFICSGIFNEVESFTLLVLASSDTRFSVATPAIAELSKVYNSLDFTDPNVTAPLYVLFSGNDSQIAERKTTPCSARVRQKLLQYLIKCHGKGINTIKGMKVIFEGLFGGNTNQKCKVLCLKFCENLVKDSPKEILSKISKVILTGVTKLIARDSEEPIEIQNSAYSAVAQLARTCPEIFNQDLKLVVLYFNHLTSAPIELHTAIREALISMAPAFSWNFNSENENKEFTLPPQQNLLLAMLSDNAESKLQIVQNVTSVFLTTCFPETYPPARYLLLLIAGYRSSLHESIISHLYGVSKKDQINYTMLSSIDHPEDVPDDFNKLFSEQRRVVLPGFKPLVNHIWEMSKRRMASSIPKTIIGNKTLPFNLNTYEEILDYLRLCLWFSAGVKTPGNDENSKLRDYILKNYEDSEENEINRYLNLVQTSVEAKRGQTNLLCLYDLLKASPGLLTKSQMHLLDPLAISLKDVSETTRINVAQIYGILLGYGLNDEDFDEKLKECLNSFSQKSLEHKHGWLLVIGHAFSNKIESMGNLKQDKNFRQWNVFTNSVKLLAQMLCEQQLLVSAAIKGFSLIGKSTEIPQIEVEIKQIIQPEDEEEMETEENYKTSTKLLIFEAVFHFLKSSSVRAHIREEAAHCLGNLAIGDGAYFTAKNLEKFISYLKVNKDAALNIAISQAIVCTLNGYDVNEGPPHENFINQYCDDKTFDNFLNRLIKSVTDTNPHSRQSCSVWLLGIVKHCSHRATLLSKKQHLQFAFTELLSDDSDFVQDVASRGLGLVYSLSDSDSQDDLANLLLNQLIGGKRQVRKVEEDTELFAEGVLGKAPTGGNITTYKELCSLASDLNRPDMVYQFMQLANHNATWNSKLGSAFGLKSISKDAKTKMQPYLGKIIPRLFRYKYDPAPKIQNSMISIWDSIVLDSKEAVEMYYWDIMKEILTNLTTNEWRVRIACCLAVRDLLKRPNGLKLRSDEKDLKGERAEKMDVGKYLFFSFFINEFNKIALKIDGEVPEPELKELWNQLFRVMDDIHEGTRLAAEGTATVLSKICVQASSSEHGKSGMAVSSSIIPLILEVGVTNTVPEVRKISIKTISELIESSGSLIKPNLPSLIPCLLQATGELETQKLSYLSTRLGADSEAQEVVDSIRADAAKSHHTMETITKCIRHADYESLEKMTPSVLELIKSTMNLGTKIACAHFICLISVRIGKDMTPLVGKYLAASFGGLKDRNAVVRKYYASAIGHLFGIAKEQSIKNLFVKLEDFYIENPTNKGIPLAIHSINKRHHELLKDYMENVVPLIFFAMHEEITEENKAIVEQWKELWIDVSPGDAGIRMNLDAIIPKLEKSLEDSSWLKKAQSANAINTIATRLSENLEEKHRLNLLNLLLGSIQGRTFQGKERLLQAIASLCKGLNKSNEICVKIIDAVMKESRKEEPIYRTQALKSLGDVLESLEADRFEEVYEMTWHLLDLKSLNEENDGISADEKNKKLTILNNLKETVCETLGKSWPKNSPETQSKFQLQLAEKCSTCLKDSTRQVQVSLLIALGKFLERLQLFDADNTHIEENKEKKPRVCEGNRDEIIEKICNEVLTAIVDVSKMPHSGLKKESLNIFLILIKKFNSKENLKHLKGVKKCFEENLTIYQKDSIPEIRCRIKDIEDNLRKSLVS
ncbi:proteasome-associated protein ECM29 homolog [Condylostylus longicornis]|uniref:proteasome-associated protein ECM29 homolog n=1 Tax=Condylostylus longicornis TaxID=2530218 RepID=UPI00244DBDF2|nr:proteasome-associated protein ECM29 homolog [Condylostylus longicornis]